MSTYVNDDINILIVDDSPEQIAATGTILKPIGCQIRAANNTSYALRLIQKQIPTLILLDIKVDGMDGFELCRLLKESPKYKAIAIILMTASDTEEIIHQGISLGAQDYVRKPVVAAELLARVNAYLKIAVQAKEISHSSRELDQFCHIVSHDLKSPLQTIKQLTMLLTKDTENFEVISRLIEKSDQILEMIDRLLELSRLSSIECHYSAVDLAKTFSDTMMDLSTNLPDFRLDFRMDRLPVIWGEATLLCLLAQNILSNSLKFSKNRSVIKIHISCISTENYHTISISDNGAGFDMEYSHKLFHIFERLHSTTEFEGAGVGLTIIQRIMKRHGGTVSIWGQPDAGAKVTLKFPTKERIL